MSRRPALIFDFGNVIAHFDYLRLCDRLGRTVGLSAPEYLERAVQAGFTETLKEYERGDLSSRAFHERLSAMTGLSMSFDDFVPAWGDIFWENESLREVIAKLKRSGYPLLLGSNTNEIHADHYRGQFAETLGKFDRLVLSYEVRAIKPSARFYEACVAASGLPADDCIFIDDLDENVQAAAAAELVGLHYVDTPRLIEELQGLGILT